MVAEFWRTIEGHYPILILGWIGTSADTGFLRVALSVAVLVGLTSTVVNTVLMPRISALWAKRELIDLQTLLTRAAVMSISVTTVAAFAVVVLGRDLLRIAFGAEYEAAWVPLFVVAISYVVNSSSGAVVTLLNMTGHERVVLFAYAGSACVGAGLAIAFQASFGAIGVPIAMVLAELVKCIGLCLVAAKRLGLRASAVSGLHPRMP